MRFDDDRITALTFDSQRHLMFVGHLKSAISVISTLDNFKERVTFNIPENNKASVKVMKVSKNVLYAGGTDGKINCWNINL